MPSPTASSRSLAPLDPAQLPPPQKVIALLGAARALHPLVLESFSVRVARGERVGVIVGDNRFDAYALARRARAQGFAPAEWLTRIELSREYTCYQLHHAVMTLDTARFSAWSALYVLGLLETFYDEDVELADARRLLSTGLARLKQLAAQGLPVLITLAPPREPGRAGLIDLVLRAVDAYWQPSPRAVEQLALQQMSFSSFLNPLSRSTGERESPTEARGG